MKLKPSLALLSLCGVTAIVPARVHAFDGLLVAGSAVQQNRRGPPQSRRVKKAEQQGQPVEQVKSETEYKHESERAYGYGYERRHHEGNDGRNRR